MLWIASKTAPSFSLTWTLSQPSHGAPTGVYFTTCTFGLHTRDLSIFDILFYMRSPLFDVGSVRSNKVLHKCRMFRASAWQMDNPSYTRQAVGALCLTQSPASVH